MNIINLIMKMLNNNIAITPQIILDKLNIEIKMNNLVEDYINNIIKLITKYIKGTLAYAEQYRFSRLVNKEKIITTIHILANTPNNFNIENYKIPYNVDKETMIKIYIDEVDDNGIELAIENGGLDFIAKLFEKIYEYEKTFSLAYRMYINVMIKYIVHYKYNLNNIDIVMKRVYARLYGSYMVMLTETTNNKESILLSNCLDSEIDYIVEIYKNYKDSLKFDTVQRYLRHKFFVVPKWLTELMPRNAESNIEWCTIVLNKLIFKYIKETLGINTEKFLLTETSVEVILNEISNNRDALKDIFNMNIRYTRIILSNINDNTIDSINEKSFKDIQNRFSAIIDAVTVSYYYKYKKEEQRTISDIIFTLLKYKVYYTLELIKYIYGKETSFNETIKSTDNPKMYILKLICKMKNIDIPSSLDNIPEELYVYFRYDVGIKKWTELMNRVPKIEDIIIFPVYAIEILSKHFKLFMKLMKKYNVKDKKDKVRLATLVAVYRHETERIIEKSKGILSDNTIELLDKLKNITLYPGYYYKWKDVLNINKNTFDKFISVTIKYMENQNYLTLLYDKKNKIKIIDLQYAIFTMSNKDIMNKFNKFTMKEFKASMFIGKYENIEDIEFAIAAGKAKYNAMEYKNTWEKAKTITIPKDDIIPNIKIEKDNYTMQKIQKGDWTGLFIGEYTDCCQHPLEAGQSCAWYGTENEKAGFIAFKKDNEIIGQAFVWTNKDIIMFDNIEVLGDTYSYWVAIADMLQEWALIVINKTKFNEVRLGVGFTPGHIINMLSDKFGNIIKDSFMFKFPTLDYNGYTDAMEGQWIIASNKQKEENNTVIFSIDAAIRLFKEHICDIERKVYPEDMWTYNNSNSILNKFVAIVDKNWYFIAEIEEENMLYISDFAKLPEYKMNIKDMIIIRKTIKEFVELHNIKKIAGHFRKSTSYRFLKIMEKEYKSKFIEYHDRSQFDSNNEEYIYAEMEINGGRI